MNDKLSRRQLLKTTAAGTAGMAGLTGVASAQENPLDSAYTVITYQQSGFVPQVLPITAGGTVEFVGNRFPHTITSTNSWQNVLNDCSNGGRAPYNGDAECDKPEEGNDGIKGDDGVIRATIESPDEAYSVFLESGGTTRITYEQPGRYTYYCVPHCGSFMVGEVLVLPGTGGGGGGGGENDQKEEDKTACECPGEKEDKGEDDGSSDGEGENSSEEGKKCPEDGEDDGSDGGENGIASRLLRRHW